MTCPQAYVGTLVECVSLNNTGTRTPETCSLHTKTVYSINGSVEPRITIRREATNGKMIEHLRKQSQVFYLQFNQPVPNGFFPTEV